MQTYTAARPGSIRLLGGELYHRYTLNANYMMRLHSDKLLLNFYNEAGLVADSLPSYTLPEGVFTGWESPTCQLRGHFLGHFLSGCAFSYAYMGNEELKGRGDHIVRELRRIQLEHGDGWCFSIPQQYMQWIARGKRIWAPSYTVHKTLMGLMDMHRFAGSELALTVAIDAAKWFRAYTDQFTEEKFDEIIDVETGGMMEFFADLYGETGDADHKYLMERYYRRKLFEPLMKGEDVLTNMHANTTIPEVLGVARAYEVTGERKYLDVVKAYWDCAVTHRGYFATGGQTSYEAWTAPFQLKDRLNEDNQEHCTVYNMIRLAEFLFRHTGAIEYQDYIELNFENGILAQQHPDTGMVAYYLPMQPGGKANWGTETGNFWCCHGTLVQVQNLHAAGTVFGFDGGALIAQYRPVDAKIQVGGRDVNIRIAENFNFPYALRRPYPKEIQASIQAFTGRRYSVKVSCQEETEFELQLRIPWWVRPQAQVAVDGEVQPHAGSGSVMKIKRAWKDSEITLYFPTVILEVPLPDDENRMAFIDGPDVLVGLTASDALTMPRGVAQPRDLVRRESRMAHVEQVAQYTITAQGESVPMIRLKDLRDERYTMYFTVRDEQ